MSAPTAFGRRGAAAAALLVLGLVLCVGYRIVGGTEHHAFSPTGEPPSSYHLTAGNVYELSVRGGVKYLLDHGQNLTAPACSWSVGGSAAQALTVSPQNDQSKATNVVATFIAPYTGDLAIQCTDWGAVYVDDADNSSSDVGGWLLVIGIIALTIGAGLGLSALRTSAQIESAHRAVRQYDEVETFADAGGWRPGDDEVFRADGDDVLH